MNSGGIRIGRMGVRMRGVTPREAERRAGSIAQEVARAVAEHSTGRAAIGSLKVRLRADGRGESIGEQIRRQLVGE
jgi:hypothetical protein